MLRRLCFPVLLLVLATASGVRAEDEEARPAFVFDAVNAPLADVLERAKAEEKLVFLDFYLPG